MRETTGDLWTLAGDARCITTNGTLTTTQRGVVGRGCAREACDRYPFLTRKLGLHLERHGNHVGVLVEGDASTVPLVAFPVKEEWHEKARFDLIKRSCAELVVLTDIRGWHTVLLPRPGCGNGRLHWADVVKILEPRLDDRFVVIYRGTGQGWEA